MKYQSILESMNKTQRARFVELGEDTSALLELLLEEVDAAARTAARWTPFLAKAVKVMGLGKSRSKVLEGVTN